ncbi:RNA polymerase II transcription factor B subunit 2 [Vitis vinifera]|uniref:RNA polymerase II transcription factor B subunit 2 n=1 Tax=Vitis vinifera TaxID=29760 RepID=A0A438IGH4_VITVI|nr:RNA polymerase II transcription factor B subunit 2 [Vitis vinifera]
MPQVKIIAKNFMDMVASLPAMKLDALYHNTFICEAILRSLPPLAKKYILQMLYIDVPVTAKAMEEWVLADGFSKHRVAIDRLIQLRVFTETSDRKKETSYRLNPTFQTNLQKHLIYGGVLPREPMPSNITVRLPSLDDLEAYALGQWECFLLQLISSTQTEKLTNFSSSLMKVFQRGLLTQREKEAPRLTESGFQFLLMDTNAQLWYIMREYISNSEWLYIIFPISGPSEFGAGAGCGPSRFDFISARAQFSCYRRDPCLADNPCLLKAYNINTLTEFQRNTIKDLVDLGLVKLQQGRKESWFIPTKLATNLSMSLSDTSSRKQVVHKTNYLMHSSTAHGFVVVETNFRLYAYSSSKLHCEILRLFSRVEYQLPNLIVGAITKESLYNAFENGITAEQYSGYERLTLLEQGTYSQVELRLAHISPVLRVQ